MTFLVLTVKATCPTKQIFRILMRKETVAGASQPVKMVDLRFRISAIM
jgi:hypothetical protein